tara:strand:+ start:633 stop:1151 length:519 start_codon:yes stop_codon:yes gene_type:complete
MKQERCEEGYLLISKKEVTKVLTRPGLHWSVADYELYKKFSEQHEYCVKITEFIDTTHFKMEKLDIMMSVQRCLDTKDHKIKNFVDEELIYRIVETWTRIYHDCLEFSKKNLPPNRYFLHGDMHTGNLVITKDKQVKLIDPNSFETHQKFLLSSYISGNARLLTDALMWQYL